MPEALIILGFILLFIAVVLIVIGIISSGKMETKFAFGGFIGPLPFGFANDPKLLWAVIIISVLIIVFYILSNRIF